MFCSKKHYVLTNLLLLNVLINEINTDQYENLNDLLRRNLLL